MNAMVAILDNSPTRPSSNEEQGQKYFAQLRVPENERTTWDHCAWHAFLDATKSFGREQRILGAIQGHSGAWKDPMVATTYSATLVSATALLEISLPCSLRQQRPQREDWEAVFLLEVGATQEPHRPSTTADVW